MSSSALRSRSAGRRLRTATSVVDSRDRELERMSRLLDGGKSFDVVSLEARNRGNERMIAHQNIQIDYLQNKNQELEAQMGDVLADRMAAKNQSFSASLKSQRLEQDLMTADEAARRAQVDKGVVIATADRELDEAKVELERSHRELQSADFSQAHLKGENDRMQLGLEERRSELASLKTDYARLDDLVTRVQDDKRKLSGRVNRLVSHERELVLEISRMKNKNGVTKPAKGTKPSARVETLIRDVEAERDYYKEEVETLNKLLKSRLRSSSVSGKARSRPSSRPSSPVRDNGLNAKAAALEATVRVMEEERDHWRREYDRLQASRSRPTSPVRVVPTGTAQDAAQIMHLQGERDELKRLLDKFERHMAEIQANVKVLTSERDNLNGLYDETRAELQRLRREMIRSPKSPKTSLAAQAVLRRVENERDEAVGDLRRMTTERDSLRERLKIATESHIADRAKLEQQVEDLQTALRDADADRHELATRVTSLRETVALFEEQLKTKEMELYHAKDNASASKSAATQLKLLSEQSERNLDETQRALSRREVDVKTLSDEKRILQERIDDLARANQGNREDIAGLRGTVSALDREKDSLQAAVDDKTERGAGLEGELYAKEKLISDLKSSVAELEIQLQRSRDDGAVRDREVGSLRRQLAQVQEELAEVSRGRDAAVRDNRRLQEDLGTMTRENQQLHGEIQDTRGEAEVLKTQVQDYISEVKRTEDQLALKEQERTDLLEQYRRMTAEHDMMTSHRHQLESEGSNLRIEITTRDSEIRRLRDRNDDLEREVSEHVSSLRAYEVQVSQLTKQMAALESNFRSSEAERTTLLTDLGAVRDLCAKLDAGKETLTRQLTAKGLDAEQLQNRAEELATELELTRSHASTESETVRNLEAMLAGNREKEFQAQLGLQERSAEAHLLKDRLALSEGKIDTLNREISGMRARNIELDSELDRLRRQVTAERFDRERAQSEMRRQGLSSSGVSSMRRSYSPSSRARSRSPATRRSFLDDEDGF